MNKAIIGICIISAALLSACGPDPRSTRVVARIASPDGTREAVYSEDMSGGATVSPSEEIYVVAKDSAPRLQDRVFSQERVCNLRVRWLNDKAIEIGYSARRALADRSIGPDRLEVHTRWLGRDPASGC